jgi:hypothetical protein
VEPIVRKSLEIAVDPREFSVFCARFHWGLL